MAKRKELLSLVGFVAVTIVALLANVLAGNTPALGLDLQGGASVTLEPVGEFESDAIDVAKDIIQQRVDSLGIAEPEIIRQGDTIVVNLPGVKDQEEAVALVGRTGAVQLRPVLSVSANIVQTPDTTVPGATTVPADATATTAAADGSTTTPTTTVDTSADTTAATSSTAAEGPARQPMAGTTVAPPTTTTNTASTTVAPADGSTTAAPDTTVADASSTTAPVTATTAPGDSTPTVPPANGDPTQTVTLPSEDGTLLYTLGPAGGTGEVFTNDADAEIQGGAWGVVVGLRGGAVGEGVWNALASQCYSGTATCPPQGADGRGQMAIVLDGEVISAPTVNAPSFSGSVSITGDFSEGEARQLAKILKFGAVPVQMEPQAVETVSATLGKDSLHAAIYSGLLGLALVVVFMVFYYRTFALIIVGGLALSAALQWSVIVFLSRTQGLALTLSGIAGIIVSIGITVDSFVVLFERVKDELQHGRTLRVATTRGVAAGWRTTLAANTVSLLGAVVLWWLTVGSVRGFAFFLGLSTAIDLVILWFFTRPSVLLLGRSKKRGHRLFGVDVAQPPTTARVPS